MALAFDNRDGVNADEWTDARGFLLEQLDRLYASLQPISMAKFSSIVTFQLGQVALGTGVAPTLGTIAVNAAAPGPKTAAQSGWQQVTLADGTSAYLPYWK